MVKLSVNQVFIQIFQFIDWPMAPVDVFNNSEYFGSLILIRALRKLGFLFTYYHKLSYTVFSSYRTQANRPLMYSPPYCYYVCNGDFSWSLANCIIYRKIVTSHKILEYIDIYLRILISEILGQFITHRPMCAFKYRTLHFGVSVDTKLEAFSIYNILQLLIQKLLAFLRTMIRSLLRV